MMHGTPGDYVAVIAIALTLGIAMVLIALWA